MINEGADKRRGGVYIIRGGSGVGKSRAASDILRDAGGKNSQRVKVDLSRFSSLKELIEEIFYTIKKPTKFFKDVYDFLKGIVSYSNFGLNIKLPGIDISEKDAASTITSAQVIIVMDNIERTAPAFLPEALRFVDSISASANIIMTVNSDSEDALAGQNESVKNALDDFYRRTVTKVFTAVHPTKEAVSDMLGQDARLFNDRLFEAVYSLSIFTAAQSFLKKLRLKLEKYASVKGEENAENIQKVQDIFTAAFILFLMEKDGKFLAKRRVEDGEPSDKNYDSRALSAAALFRWGASDLDYNMFSRLTPAALFSALEDFYNGKDDALKEAHRLALTEPAPSHARNIFKLLPLSFVVCSAFNKAADSSQRKNAWTAKILAKRAVAECSSRGFTYTPNDIYSLIAAPAFATPQTETFAALLMTALTKRLKNYKV